jgi:hypothetical protein
MSREEQRRRVPTSEELERQGALAPAGGARAEKRGGLMRFFRAGRFRVSDDVAARKHMGVVSRHQPTDLTAEATPRPGQASASSSDLSTDVPAPTRATGAIAPRTIRIDPSVKERRGLGRDGDARR